MTPERWAEAGRLLLAARGIPAADRVAFLEGECRGDSELKSELASLQASLDPAESFLDQPAAGQTAAAPLRVGPYDLLEEIGRGGMGVVYRAVRRDQGFERFVAVKLVKRGMDTDFILRRFESERRILAGLDHANIARVLDGGATDEGVPYFVMELIEGQNILEDCDEKKLGVSERLVLFRQVCSAVQYAHQRLVIHRDIKPSNILVTPEGVLKLLDFGLAKVLVGEEGGTVDRTETGLRALTPEYASPEQIRGEEVTTSSDVYSLGVVLYEVLTGGRPFTLKTRSPEELTDAILHREPERPSTKTRLHSDLEAITLMTLRKEPARRYTSVEQLSEDIRRHLEGLPVRARPDSFGYRSGKFIRRHRVGAAASVLIAASLVGGLGLALWQMRVARSERDHARLETARAQEVSAFLRSLFQSSTPRQARGQKLTAQELVDAGAARVDRELAHQPDLHASMLALLGSVYLELGLSEKAEPLLSQSLALREKLPGGEHVEVADSLYWLSRLKGRQGDYRGSEELAKRAIRIREQTPGSESALAEALSQLGGVLRNLGRLDEARDLFQRAVAIEEKSGGPNLYKWLTNLAAVEVDLDNFDSGRRLAERALEIGVRSEGKADVQVDVTMLNLASLATAQEDYPRALSLFEQALAIDERAFGKESGSNVYTLGEMGELYLAMGDYRRAHQALDRAIGLGQRAFPPGHLSLAAPLTYLGRVLLAEGNPREALSYLERGLALREKSLPGPDHEEIAESLTDIALATKQLEGPAAAEPILRRALAIRRHVLVAGHRSLVPTLTALGRVLLDLRRESEARPLLAEAVEIARAKLPERHSQRLAAEQALPDVGR